jgi:predicted TIM-barrel fold metal-dependent hydrolase
MFGRPPDPAVKDLMKDSGFRKGAAALERYGLSLDLWCFHTQLQDLADLASACPGTIIVLDHIGTPLYTERSPRRDAQVFAAWREGIAELARRSNVRVKLGGLGLDFSAPLSGRHGTRSSSQLASEWQPFIETCIGAFGPQRCMFESNFPPDGATCSYGALWNAFKRITANYSNDDKQLLFGGVAKGVYRLD